MTRRRVVIHLQFHVNCRTVQLAAAEPEQHEAIGRSVRGAAPAAASASGVRHSVHGGVVTAASRAAPRPLHHVISYPHNLTSHEELERMHWQSHPRGSNRAKTKQVASSLWFS